MTLTPAQAAAVRRITRWATRVTLLCLVVFVLGLMFVEHLPGSVYEAVTNSALLVGGVAGFLMIMGFVLDPRVREFFDADNPAYRRDRDG